MSLPSVWRKLRRATSIAAILWIVALATGCSGVSPAPVLQSWDGTVTTGDVTVDLQLDVTVSASGTWTGTYTVLADPTYTGVVEATSTGNTLRGTLTATRSCTFELDGRTDGRSLTATFVPTGCFGAMPGRWGARRLDTPRRPVDTSPPSGERATFGTATFGSARFQ